MQLGDPVLGLGERRGLCDVVDDERGLGVAVVHGRERGEAFLAGCVPDLKLDCARGQVAFLGEKGGYVLSARALACVSGRGAAHLLSSAPCSLGSRC